eukprot:844881-Pelagomonas_calceolata.AAC.1
MSFPSLACCATIALETPVDATGWAVGVDWTCSGGGPGCSGADCPGGAVPEQAEGALVHVPIKRA